MIKLNILQKGSKRSIIEITYLDTKEKEILMVNNDYIINYQDDLGISL